MVIIDRFEGDWAVLEWEGRVFSFPRALVPEDSREGDILNVTLSVDGDATSARRRKMGKLEENLFKDS